MSESIPSVTPEILAEIKEIQQEIAKLRQLKKEADVKPKRKTTAKRKTRKN